jgi:hypothetical protein
MHECVWTPDARGKDKILLDLEDLKTRSSNLHWILAGDFNIITSLAEKK